MKKQLKLLLIALAALSLMLLFAGCDKQETATEEETAEAEVYYYGMLILSASSEEEFDDICNDCFDESHAYLTGGTPEQWLPEFYNDTKTALMALDKGDIIEFYTCTATANYIMAQYPDKYRTEPPENEQIVNYVYAMAVKDEDSELLQQLNDAITTLKDDGTLAALEQQYLTEMDPEAVDIPVIEGADTLTVYITGEFPPFDYVTAEGKAAGYNVALLSAIAEKLGVNIELIYGDAASRMTALASGRADIVFVSQGLFMKNIEATNYSLDTPEGISCTEAYTTQDVACMYAE